MVFSMITRNFQEILVIGKISKHFKEFRLKKFREVSKNFEDFRVF